MPSFMTRHACTLLLLISGFVATATPHDTPAQGSAPKVEEGPGPYNIDLDVTAGDDQEHFLPVPPSAFTIKGFIQFLALRSDPKWTPLAAIEVTGPKDSFYAGLIAFVLPKAPDKIEFAVRDERLRGLPDASFGRIHLTSSPIPFELRLDRSGVLQTSVMGTPGRVVSVRSFEISWCRARQGQRCMPSV